MLIKMNRIFKPTSNNVELLDAMGFEGKKRTLRVINSKTKDIKFQTHWNYGHSLRSGSFICYFEVYRFNSIWEVSSKRTG